MYYAIEALTYLFDMGIIIIYMNGIFHKENRRTAYPLYIACFLIMEVLIYVNQTLCTGLPSKQFTIATNMVSLLTTFALTFLYRTRLSNRIFVSISFQILALLGESFFLFLVKIINPAVIELPLRQLSILMNLGSKIMLFLLILVVIFYWNRHIKYHDYKYNLLLFTTPRAFSGNYPLYSCPQQLPVKQCVLYDHRLFCDCPVKYIELLSVG